MDIRNEKNKVRERMVRQRTSFHGLIKKRADIRIAHQLFAHPMYKNAKTVFITVSLPEEVNTHEIIKNELKDTKKIIVIPKITDGLLQLFHLRSLEDLVKGAYGIMEPVDTCQQMHVNSIDVFIIPGVAFDRTGRRLGRGKGFTDALLRNVHASTIGLAYEFQMFDAIPSDVWDVNVQNIVTEKQWYSFSS